MTNRHHPALLFLGLGLAGLLLACSSGDRGGAGGGSGGSGDAGLDGRTFVSETLTVHFTDGRLSAQPGCNTLGATYAVEDGRLVTADVAMTEMACADPALMTRDEAFAAFLAERPTVTLDGDTLTLTGDTVTHVLTDRRVADPDRPLVGTVWQLDTIVEGESASSVPEGASATLSLPDETTIGWTARNSASAPVVVTDTTLEIGPAQTTLIGCTGPPAEVEAAMGRVLTGTATWSIEADRLTLTNGTHGLGFHSSR